MATVKETQKLTNAAGYYLSSTDNKYPGDEMKTILAYHGGKKSKVSDTWFSNFKVYVLGNNDRFGLEKAGESVAANWSDDKIRAFIRASGLEKELRSGKVTADFGSASRKTLLMTIGSLLRTDRNGGWTSGDIKGERWQKGELDKWAADFDQHYALVSKAVQSAASQGGISSEQLQNTFDTIFGEDGYSPEAARNLLAEDNFQLQTAVGSTLTAANTPEPEPEPTPEPVEATEEPDPIAEAEALTTSEKLDTIVEDTGTAAVVATDTAAEDVVQSGESRELATEGGEQVADAAQDSVSIENAYTGGEVDSNVANALGWTRSADGKSYTDPATDTVYNVDPDTGLLTNAETGNTAFTQGMMNFEEYDFAGDYEDIVNNYLFGNTVSTEEALQQGYTQNEDGSFTGPNGQTYQAAGGVLQDVDGTPLRTQGFTDYQTDLEGAAQEYTTQMGTLRGEYQKAFGDYNQELRPRLQQLDDTTAGLTEVAQDAADQNYYGRLQDVYFADAAEGIQSDVDSARDTLQTNYAASGADPNSPAYTAAIMDLQNKRGDAMRSARRQALLDSYSLGGNMLANRTNALSSAQSGILGGINALGSLYDVKIKGLDVDKDMISTIYQGKQNQADIGVRGLNTIAQAQQGIVDKNEADFARRLNLTTGLNTDTLNTGATSAATNTNLADSSLGAASSKLNMGKFFRDMIQNDVLTKGGLKIQMEEAGIDPLEFFTQDDLDALQWNTP